MLPLPMTMDELRQRGWSSLDILLVTGDAYVDHPAFGVALIGAHLAAAGFRVGLVSQPQQAEDLARLGRPRLFVGVTAGNLDSMLNRCTAARKLRSQDAYAPGGQPGLRPERATIVYATWARQVHKGVPVVLGGVEASLRRFAHYDYWQDSIRRSVLADAKAELLVFGMGERQVLAVAQRLAAGTTDLHGLPGTCWLQPVTATPPSGLVLPDFEQVRSDPQAFAAAAVTIHDEQDPHRGRRLVQDQGWCRLVQEPPALPLDPGELDAVHALPFTRRAHPSYRQPIPALATVRWSLQTHRGCPGDCAFCALGAHQGRIVSSRSPASLLAEARILAADPDFPGTIDDAGGPTANCYGCNCSRWSELGACAQRRCLGSSPCPNLITAEAAWLDLLHRLRTLPGIRHVFVQSGLRHDLLLRLDDRQWAEFLRHHLPGRLKVAPESADDAVLALMGKPPWQVFTRFLARVRAVADAHDLRCPVAPYLIAAHPGADLAGTAEAALRLQETGLHLELAQEFIPAPLTLATAMYVSGCEPRSGQPIPVPKGDRGRRLHKALLHPDAPDSSPLVREALASCGRSDLAGRLLPHSGKKTRHGR